MININSSISDVFSMFYALFMWSVGIAVLIPLVSFGFKLVLYNSGSSSSSVSVRDYYLGGVFNKLKSILRKEKNELSKYNDKINVIDSLEERIMKLQSAFNNLYDVEKKIRNQTFDYFEVACFHEYESIKKIFDVIDRGIPVTHNNVLPLVKTVVSGLEEKYEKFILMSTEEIVQETKDLKLLQMREKEDLIFIDKLESVDRLNA